MLDFLKTYGEYIASGILLILAVITLIVKRRPKTVDDFVQAIAIAVEQLPEIINMYESPGDGALKKSAVLSVAVSIVTNLLGRKLTDNEIKAVEKKVGEQIEAILSTPQKKIKEE